MSYRVKSQLYSTFGFTYLGDNKTVEIEIGQDGDLVLGDILEAVKDVLIAGGFDYIDEVRAVNYGENVNIIYSSDSESYSWTEPADGLPDDDDLPRVMAEETLREVEIEYDNESTINPVYSN